MSDDPDPAVGTRIAALGAYAPRLRIDAEAFEAAWGRFEAAGVEQKAVPAADEDALTMAVKAAQRALDAAGRSGEAVEHLALATTTPPMAEEDLTARLSSILGVGAGARTRTHTGSTRAGVQALDGALDAGPWGDGVGLVAVGDCPRGAPDSEREHAAGAGGAAVVLDGEGPGAVLDRASYTEPYPGTRFRPAGETETTGLGITGYDREAFRATLGGARERLSIHGDTLDAVDAAAVQSPDGGLPYRVADALGVGTDEIAAADTVSNLGDTGAASTLLGAAKAFAEGAQRVVLAACGSGAGATILVVDGPVPVERAVAGEESLTYAAYLRQRGEITSGEPEGGGAYVSVPSWQRTLPQRHRLVAGRCRECGALNFPPEGACRSCAERGDYESVALPGTGTVEAATTISPGGAPPEFVEQTSRSGPYAIAIVAFDGPDGGSVSVPAQVVGDRPAIGDRVEATVRRIYEQEGVVRYGFKVQRADTRG
jgi:hydroxymethylglutaryl-CoA synthase